MYCVYMSEFFYDGKRFYYIIYIYIILYYILIQF